MPWVLSFMRLLVQMLFKFIDSFSHWAVASLLTKALQAGQHTVYKQRLFFLDGCHIIFMVLANFFDVLVLFSLLVHPPDHFGKVGEKRNKRTHNGTRRDDALPG